MEYIIVVDYIYWKIWKINVEYKLEKIYLLFEWLLNFFLKIDRKK